MSGVTNVCAMSTAPQAPDSRASSDYLFLESLPKEAVPLTRIQLINKLHEEGNFDEIGRVVGSTQSAQKAHAEAKTFHEILKANPTEPVHRTHQARAPGAEVSIQHLLRLINTVSSIIFRVIGSLANLFYYCISSPWYLSRLIQTQLIGVPSKEHLESRVTAKDPLAGKVATVAE